MLAIELKNLSVSYHHKPILKKISGTFAIGSLTAITGRNGAGKSTLLKVIAGIIPAKKEALKIHISHERIAYLPQISEIQSDFPISVLHLVSSAYFQRFGGFCEISAEMKENAIAAIEEVGLNGLENNAINTLSFGQLQRALFARLIVQDAQLILLDEPFAAIDFITIAKLNNIIKKWHQEKRTVICVLHDFEQIKNGFHDCIVLDCECLAWGRAEDALRNYQLKTIDCHTS